jgi:glutamate synthase domain-containing protein 3
MKTISVYVTDDGKQFQDRNDARAHEVHEEAVGKLRQLLQSAIHSTMCRQGNIDNVLRNLLMESQEVSNILNSYRRQTPKAKEEPQQAKEAA